MSFPTKKQRDELSQLIIKLEQAKTAVETAVDRYNTGVAQLAQPVESSVEHYNTLLEEIGGITADVAAEMGDEYDNKSEKWQESEAGQDLNDLANEWDSINLDAVSVDYPTELDCPYMDHTDELIDLLENES